MIHLLALMLTLGGSIVTASAGNTPGSSAGNHPKKVTSAKCQTCPRSEKVQTQQRAAAKSAFARQTGYPRGRPGYVISYIAPLACGGADEPANMRWETMADAKWRESVERVNCQ